MRKEVWKVVVHSFKDRILENKYHVFATSAAMAGRRGLKLARADKMPQPYCLSAAFAFNVY